MSDETETPATETPKEDSADKQNTTVKLSSPLSRPTDAVARPGFRNPSNKGSHAQKRRK
jgi:hypothetical protein